MHDIYDLFHSIHKTAVRKATFFTLEEMISIIKNSHAASLRFLETAPEETAETSETSQTARVKRGRWCAAAGTGKGLRVRRKQGPPRLQGTPHPLARQPALYGTGRSRLQLVGDPRLLGVDVPGTRRVASGPPSVSMYACLSNCRCWGWAQITP